MAMYNSHAGFHEDESDITIINPSITQEHNDGYVDNTQTTNNNNPQNQNIDDKNGFIFVDHDPVKIAKQLEEVLTYYIRDLKQESTTQLDCDKQLVTRLMDLIRPAYVDNQQKMVELDKKMEDIGLLHDKRHIEQKEKIEQLRTEICRLNKILTSANNDHSMYNDNTKNYSMFSTMQQRPSINDYDQWTEIEDDAKKLHEIVQSQKNQINEIVSLISQAATAPTSFGPTNVLMNRSEDATNNKQSTSTTNTSMISTLIQKIKDITGQQEPIPVASNQEPILENPSPGTSPSQSLATLTLEILTPTIDDRHKQIEEQHDKPIVEQERPHIPIDIPVAPAPAIETKKCHVCNYEFALTSDDMEMYDHIEKCLFPPGASTQPKDYECPICHRKFAASDEKAYHEHLSDCYNRDI